MATATKSRKKTSARKSRKSTSSSSSSSTSQRDKELLGVLGADDASDETKQRLLKQNKEQMKAGEVTGSEASAAKADQKLAEEDPVSARSKAGNRWQDQMARRDASEALQGHFANVVDGEHKGRYGVYDDNAELDDNGRPVTIIIETRDDATERIVVKYEDAKLARAGGRV